MEELNMLIARKGTSTKMVYDSIKESIFMQRLKPGISLKESVVCEALNVGHSSVRSAFKMLDSEGYVKIIPNKGAVVASFSMEEMSKLYEARGEIEALAIRLGANNFTTEDIVTLDEYIAQERDALRNRSPKDYLSSTEKFHTYLVRKADNQYLEEIFSLLYQKIKVCLALYDGLVVTDFKDSVSLKFHTAMVQAIARLDIERLQELIRNMCKTISFNAALNFEGKLDLSTALAQTKQIIESLEDGGKK